MLERCPLKIPFLPESILESDQSLPVVLLHQPLLHLLVVICVLLLLLHGLRDLEVEHDTGGILQRIHTILLGGELRVDARVRVNVVVASESGQLRITLGRFFAITHGLAMQVSGMLFFTLGEGLGCFRADAGLGHLCPVACAGVGVEDFGVELIAGLANGDGVCVCWTVRLKWIYDDARGLPVCVENLSSLGRGAGLELN